MAKYNCKTTFRKGLEMIVKEIFIDKSTSNYASLRIRNIRNCSSKFLISVIVETCKLSPNHHIVEVLYDDNTIDATDREFELMDTIDKLKIEIERLKKGS